MNKGENGSGTYEEDWHDIYLVILYN